MFGPIGRAQKPLSTHGRTPDHEIGRSPHRSALYEDNWGILAGERRLYQGAHLAVLVGGQSTNNQLESN